jgi:hypothetical protein
MPTRFPGWFFPGSVMYFYDGDPGRIVQGFGSRDREDFMGRAGTYNMMRPPHPFWDFRRFFFGNFMT